MNTIRCNLFPGGCHHCITMSYDDGNLADVRLAQIFRDNGIAGTFHLNSGKLDQPGRVAAADIPQIYAGHEVSCHMVTHPFPTELPDAGVLAEIAEDRRVLERAAGTIVRGMSYPFGNYDDRVIRLGRAAGMEYARTTVATHRFTLPQDFMQWHPTCHHKGDILDKLDAFYAPDKYSTMRLFYIWGHSFEFNNDSNWDRIEEFSKKAAHRPDTWYATNIQVVDYVQAMRSLRVDADCTRVYNPSALEVWFTINGDTVSVKPGDVFRLQ